MCFPFSIRLVLGPILTLVLLVQGAVCAGADEPEMQTTMYPIRTREKERAELVLPRTGEFVLTADGKNVTPRRALVFYHVDETQNDRLRLSSHGRKGWAPARQVIPYREAEAYFSDRIRANPGDAFAHLARGVLRYDRSDLRARK